MTIDQNEATPPEDLKRILKKSLQRTYWDIWGSQKEKTIKKLERKKGTPRCRKEIEADGISAHEINKTDAHQAYLWISNRK